MGTFYYKTCRIKIETFKKMSYKRLAERRHGTTILIISTPAPFLRIRITVWTAMVGTRFFFSKLINPTPFLEKYINWKMFVQLLYAGIAQQFCQFHFGNTLTILLNRAKKAGKCRDKRYMGRGEGCLTMFYWTYQTLVFLKSWNK